MMRALYILQYVKRHVSGQSDVEQLVKKIKPIALAVIKLCLPEGIRQAGRQLVSTKFYWIFF